MWARPKTKYSPSNTRIYRYSTAYKTMLLLRLAALSDLPSPAAAPLPFAAGTEASLGTDECLRCARAFVDPTCSGDEEFLKS